MGSIWRLWTHLIWKTILSEAQVTILSPLEVAELYREGHLKTVNGIIPVATSAFGAPSYGESFVARVIRFPPDESSYCNAESAYIRHNAKEIVKNFTSSTESDAATAFLVDRGGCSFMEKALLAEQNGADVVIFIDSSTSDWDRNTLRNVIVADNGHGIHVKIPSVIMTYEDGQGLIKYAQTPSNYQSGTPLLVQFNWELNQSDVVKVDFWMSSSMPNAIEFIANLAPMATALGPDLRLIPHFYVVELEDLDEASSRLMCYQSDTRYCVPSKRGASSTSDGAAVLDEDIRQLCLLEVGGHSTAKKEALWMDYIAKMYKECKQIPDPTCSDSILHTLGGSRLVDEMTKCTSDVPRVKKLLETEKNSKAWAPLAIRINETRYNGNVDANLVIKTICASYSPQHRPQACTSFSPAAATPSTSTSPSGGGGMGTYLLLAGLGLLGFRWWYQKDQAYLRRTLREDVLAEVQSQLSGYQNMTDSPEMDGLPSGGVELCTRKLV